MNQTTNINDDPLTQEPEVEKSRLYWFWFNLKRKISQGVKGWIKRNPKWTWFFVLFIIYNLFVGRTMLQPLVLGIRKYLILVLLIAVVLWFFGRYTRKRSWKRNIIPSVLLIAFLSFCWFFGPGIHKYMSLYFHYSNLEKIEISEIPVSDHERIQPLNSIMTLINQEALSETEDATVPKFIRGKSGKYYFTSCIGPSRNYKLQQLSKNMYEVLSVPAYLPSPAFTAKHRSKVNFEIGEQLLFSKNTRNAVTKRFDFMQYINCEASDPLYLQNDSNQWVQVVPILKWKGIIFPRPVFAGVYVIDQESKDDSYPERLFFGKGKFYSPEDVLKTEFLKGQNLQPVEVLNYIANSFRFANGFWAPFPGYHEGDVRIPLMAEDQNPMPFITYFKLNEEGKLYNYFGLEPFEENKKGLSLSLFIAGDNDKKVYFINHRDAKFIGSSAISAKIIESKKNYDWSVNYPAESRPFVRTVGDRNRFFWLSTIVSRAGNEGEYIGGSIPEICLTDAIYGKVVWINPDSLVNSESWIKEAESELKGYWENE